MIRLDDSVEGIRARYDLVEGLELGPFDRSGYQHMLTRGGVIRRPFYASGSIQMVPFSVRLPEARLLEVVGNKQAQVSLGEQAGRVSTYAGEAAKDGSESYALSQVEILFEEYSHPPKDDGATVRPMNFMFYLDIRIGGPIPETFVQSAPRDRTSQRYWASVQVVWERVWSFFVAPTSEFALALRERVRVAHGFDIGKPPYTVSDSRRGASA